MSEHTAHVSQLALEQLSDQRHGTTSNTDAGRTSVSEKYVPFAKVPFEQIEDISSDIEWPDYPEVPPTDPELAKDMIVHMKYLKHRIRIKRIKRLLRNEIFNLLNNDDQIQVVEKERIGKDGKVVKYQQYIIRDEQKRQIEEIQKRYAQEIMMWQHEMQNVLDHFANRSEEAMSQILQRYNELDQMYRYRHRKYRIFGDEVLQHVERVKPRAHIQDTINEFLSQCDLLKQNAQHTSLKSE